MGYGEGYGRLTERLFDRTKIEPVPPLVIKNCFRFFVLYSMLLYSLTESFYLAHFVDVKLKAQ